MAGWPSPGTRKGKGGRRGSGQMGGWGGEKTAPHKVAGLHQGSEASGRHRASGAVPVDTVMRGPQGPAAFGKRRGQQRQVLSGCW